ncbi:MAG: trypsin-like peptidase domain-containing protein [Chloroflexi bacterium]|nr:trypsin-like peptidase domain-containing protein [Chloroflexota bacterium]
MTDTLLNLSNDLASIVDAAGPGVVRVEARRRLPASGVVWSPEGVIVTAHHVVERDDDLRIGLGSGETVTASIVGRDPTTDVAVLRAQVTSLSPASWADPGTSRVGHLVLALGRPRRSVRATLGIMSAVGDGWRTPAGGSVDHYLQTDAAMHPGFSGGPLVDANGHVLGLNTSALLRGITVAIPVLTVSRVVETLLAYGKIQRGYLGVGVQPARLPGTLAQQIGQETGLLVISVEAGSPADQSGLLLGDTLVSLDAEPLRYPDDLLAKLTGDTVGKQVQVRLVRGGQTQMASVTVSARS